MLARQRPHRRDELVAHPRGDELGEAALAVGDADARRTRRRRARARSARGAAASARSSPRRRSPAPRRSSRAGPRSAAPSRGRGYARGQAAFRSASSSPTVRSQVYCAAWRGPAARSASSSDRGLHLGRRCRRGRRVGVARGVAAGLRQGAGAGRHDGHAAGHRLDAGQAEALVPGGQDEGAGARVEARAGARRGRGRGSRTALALALVAELRPLAAGGDEIDALVGQPPGRGSRDARFLRAVRLATVST